MDINVNLLKTGEIKEGKNKGKAPLRFSFYYQGNRIFLGAGERALVKAWNVKAQRVTRKDIDGVEINKRLVKKHGLLIEAIRELERRVLEPSQKNFKVLFQERVDEEFKGLKPKEKTGGANIPSLPSTFWEVVEHYRKNSKNGKETIRKFKQVENRLKEFKADIDFKDFTEDFYNEYFLGFLLNIPLCDNTIDKHIQEIVKMCNYASSRFRHINIPIDYLNYKRIFQNPFRLSLSWDEVKKIEAYDPPNEDLDLAHDLFLIACYTGLRWQNVSQIKPHNIIGEKGGIYFHGITNKNKKLHSLQFSPKAVRILEKYSKEIPKAYNDDINQGIKQIARAVGLKDLIPDIKLYNGRSETTMVEKWKKVTMHVARHSFARRFLEVNKEEGALAVQGLKELLGHSSAVVTEIYVKMVGEKKDAMLLKAMD